MNNHTPGPWELELDYLHDDLHGHVPVSGENHKSLAQVVWVMENDERTPHCEANARLISAAPELLEFAKEVRRTGDTRLASMAIAIIAKATGEA